MTPYKIDDVLPQLLDYQIWDNDERFLLEVNEHSNWIMLIAEKGCFEFEIGDINGIGQAGDVLLCPPSVPFRRKMESNFTMHFFRFEWKSVSEQKIVTEPFLLSEIPIGKLALRNRDRLKENSDYLKQLFERSDPLNILQQNHLLSDIWLLCSKGAEQSTRTRWSPDPKMNAALKRIHETCYNYGFSMVSIADEIELSPVQFSRRFKKNFGLTPSAYVTELRLDKVKLLLTENTLSLQKIADLCGFENDNYLCRLFYKKMNINTSEYRRLHKL